jgi:hypothetical protein
MICLHTTTKDQYAKYTECAKNVKLVPVSIFSLEKVESLFAVCKVWQSTIDATQVCNCEKWSNISWSSRSELRAVKSAR